jgi:hypothetical protein
MKEKDEIPSNLLGQVLAIPQIVHKIAYGSYGVKRNWPDAKVLQKPEVAVVLKEVLENGKVSHDDEEENEAITNVYKMGLLQAELEGDRIVYILPTKLHFLCVPCPDRPFSWCRG